MSAVFRVEVARRFISEHDAGAIHKCPSYSNPLLLAPRELAGPVVGAILQTKKLKQFAHTRRRCIETLSGDHRGHCHVLVRRELRKQMMKLKDEPDGATPELSQCFVALSKNILSLKRNGSCCRPIQRAKQMQKCALSPFRSPQR